MTRPRTVLAAASVVLLLAVLVTALAAGPYLHRPWLAFCGLLALAMALPSITSEPKDFAWVLVFSLPPVAALVARGSPTWLAGPLAALLLVSAELNTLSWEWEPGGAFDRVRRRRLTEVAWVAGFGLAASLAVLMVARRPVMDGTIAVVAAAGGLAAVGWVVFGAATRPPPR
jgi:hypothetical protein